VLLFFAGCVVVVVVVTGGRASDAVDDSTGVAIEEESAGEEGVAAAAVPSPNRRSARGAREGSFSFSLSFADADGGCLTMCRGILVGNGGTGSTTGVISLTGTLLEAAATAIAAAPVCATLGPLAAADRGVFACLSIGVGVGVGVGDSLGVAASEPEPALALALELMALAASAHIAATDVTRPPRPPRADLTSYFNST